MKLRVAVIYGGRSGEHEISLRSAKSIIEALDPEKYKVLHYLISKEGKWSRGPSLPEPNGNPEIDVVFPVLHGTFGEDGTMQGLFELAGLALRRRGRAGFGGVHGQGSDEAACRERGLPVVDYVVLRCSDCDRMPRTYARRCGFRCS